ncbi:MAG TPA: hypothetical protein VET48_10850 [Steroidobacteraceae bacterium]|nr:hypothetical protein [Steroidobacteraceae bacterium]
MSSKTESQKWYRQFWPWLLIALPTSAVLGCAVTIALVLKNPDREIVESAPVNAVLGHNSVVPPRQ